MGCSQRFKGAAAIMRMVGSCCNGIAREESLRSWPGAPRSLNELLAKGARHCDQRGTAQDGRQTSLETIAPRVLSCYLNILLQPGLSNLGT